MSNSKVWDNIDDKRQLQLSRKELRLFLTTLLEDIRKKNYIVIEFVKASMFFSSGIFFEVDREGEVIQIYITSWYIIIIKGEFAFKWQSDTPFIFSPTKRMFRRIIREIGKNNIVPGWRVLSID